MSEPAFEVSGRIEFANIQGVERFSLTLSRGVQPAVFQFTSPVLPELKVGEVAPLFMWDGANQIIFRDCAVQSIEGDYSEGQSYTVSVMDRRWRWAYGQISGTYNTVRGGVIVNSTKKNARELAEQILSQMGETNYDVTVLPTNRFPEVDWDLEVPAVALEAICQAYGCVVCLQLDDSIKVCKMGVGKKLPYIRGVEMKEAIKINTIPDDVYVSAAPTVWEVSIKIDKPFGLERTKPVAGKVSVESIVPIAELSYIPESGWGNEDPEYFANVAKKVGVGLPIRQAVRERDRIRGLAQESVWKMFGFKFPIVLPGFGKIEDINQLVFQDELVALTTIEYKSPLQKSAYETRRASPFVYGVYYDRKETGKNNVEEFSHKWWQDEKLIYRGGFSIDKERGLIVFSDHTYLYNRDPAAKSRFKPPNLWLRVAVSAKDPKTGELWREVYKQPTSGRARTQPKWVKRADLRHEMNLDPESGKPFGGEGDNIASVRDELKYQSQIEIAKLAATTPSTAVYNGFQPIDVDGTIEQVTWEIGSDGMTTTTASYGFEHSLAIPTFDERRRVALLSAFASKQAAALTGKNNNGAR